MTVSRALLSGNNSNKEDHELSVKIKRQTDRLEGLLKEGQI